MPRRTRLSYHHHLCSERRRRREKLRLQCEMGSALAELEELLAEIERHEAQEDLFLVQEDLFLGPTFEPTEITVALEELSQFDINNAQATFDTVTERDLNELVAATGLFDHTRENFPISYPAPENTIEISFESNEPPSIDPLDLSLPPQIDVVPPARLSPLILDGRHSEAEIQAIFANQEDRDIIEFPLV